MSDSSSIILVICAMRAPLVEPRMDARNRSGRF
jgi:hypothetical protein